MPFVAPWRDFQAGDLVYGVETRLGRGAFIAANQGSNIGTSRIDNYRVLQSEKDHGFGLQKVPAGMLKSFEKALARDDKYGAAVRGGDDNATVRKKSKGGLYWATMASEHTHVHFVLDDINEDEVIGKSHSTDQGHSDDPNKERGVTGSELRWVYRNREHDRVQARIQFWHHGVQCAPPWDDHAGSVRWSQYKPQLTSVHAYNADGERSGCCCFRR